MREKRPLDRLPRWITLFVAVLGVALVDQNALAAAGDTVAGTFQAGGKTYKLSHVYVRRQPSPSDKSRTVVVVLLTDNEVPKAIVDDKYRLELTDLARQGKIHGVSITIGSDKKPEGTGFTYAKELDGAIVNRADQHALAATAFDDSKLEGKLSGGGTFGDSSWKYEATVKAGIGSMK
jgi:hypothetical protein